MKIARTVVCVSSALVLGLAAGCASTSPEEKVTAAQTQSAPAQRELSGVAAKAIEDARAAVKKAESVNGLWRDPESLIKQAEAALAQGNEATAIKLAQKAKKEAELGYQQAMDERKNWRAAAEAYSKTMTANK
jgi:hypothetical protein